MTIKRMFQGIAILSMVLFCIAVSADSSYGKNNHHGDKYHYKYIPLTNIPVPPGYTQLIPAAIDDSGRVYGNVGSLDSAFGHVAVYEHGKLTVYKQGYVNPGAVNARGTTGGFITNPQTYNLQAALFSDNRVKLIPYLPGETQTYILALNDSDTALVWSQDPFNENTYRLVKNGKTLFSYKLPTGSDMQSWGVNNRGDVSGNIYDPNLNAFRAIRFHKPYGEPILLTLLSTDTDSTSFGINNSGNIIGYSNNSSDNSGKTHIGIWDSKGNFKTYAEGLCCILPLFNDNNLIVLTQNYDTNKSYLIPRPGVLLNIENLLVNPTDMDTQLLNIVDINNHGDMVGYGPWDDAAGIFPPFLLRRLP